MDYCKRILMVLVASALFGCQADSARDQINSQNEADYSAKAGELIDVAYTWTGKMHLTLQNKDFDCILTLAVTPQNQKSSQPESPSETARIATLGGNLTFPALVNLPLQDYRGFQSLFNPLDGLAIVDIVYGDYEENDQSFVLPYMDSQQKSTFGNLSGSLINGGTQISGVWFANDFGNVGTFMLNRQLPTTSLEAAGGTRR